jgi:hypothetical protein
VSCDTCESLKQAISSDMDVDVEIEDSFVCSDNDGLCSQWAKKGWWAPGGWQLLHRAWLGTPPLRPAPCRWRPVPATCTSAHRRLTCPGPPLRPTIFRCKSHTIWMLPRCKSTCSFCQQDPNFGKDTAMNWADYCERHYWPAG